MSSLNKVMLIGRLGKDVEIKPINNGKSVGRFSIATTMMKPSGDAGYGNQPQEVTEWHNIVVWDKLAENCQQFLSKGKMAYVEGRLQTRKWDNNGQTHYTTEVVAHSVLFLTPKTEGHTGAPHGGHTQAQSQQPIDTADLPF